jgi:nitroreductase
VDAFDAIMTRRSIRKYTDEPVSDGKVETILRAAMAAPSAFNEQRWRFVVVREPAQLALLSEATPYAGALAGAAAGIVVCGETSEERTPGYWMVECSAATENALLAANALGLGAVWLGVAMYEDRVDNVRRILALPEHIAPLAMIALGHPAQTREAGERFDRDKVHNETWHDAGSGD